MRDRTSRLSGFVLPYPTVKLQGTIIRFKSDTWPARLWARSPLLCGLGSIRGPGVTWRLSFWLVLVHALFHLVVQFFSPYENQHFNFKFDLETMDKKSHLVESPPLNSSYNYHYYIAFDNDNPSSMQGAHIWIRSYFSYQANLVTEWRVSTMIAVWTLRMVMSNVDALNILALTAEKSFVAPTAKPTWICALWGKKYVEYRSG